MGILSPSVDVDSHGWASPLILGGPTSPSGSGEGFLFLAVLATGKKTKHRKGKRREINEKCTAKHMYYNQTEHLTEFLPSKKIKRHTDKMPPSSGCMKLQHLKLRGL